MKILGVKIDQISFEEALNKCLGFARKNRQNYVVTPNPEMLLMAQKNSKYKKILNEADLKTPDGIGVIWAGSVLKEIGVRALPYSGKWLVGAKNLLKIFFKKRDSYFPERVCGSDLMIEICKKLRKSDSVYILGGIKGAPEEAAKNLKKNNINLNIVGTSSALVHKSNDEIVCNEIVNSKAKILFVGLGAPKQELWIYRNLKRLKGVKLIMGIGGSIDFAAEKIKRAPFFMRKIGLEWFYRLIKQPSRITRIINAIIVFPIKFLKSI